MDRKTARYKIVPTILGNKYLFYCDLSGALVCTSKLVHMKTTDLELDHVWTQECHRYFNQCQRCGRWIIDAMYNPEVLECVHCAPYEEDPAFCKSCGAKIENAGRICPTCGKPFIYEGVGN